MDPYEAPSMEDKLEELLDELEAVMLFPWWLLHSSFPISYHSKIFLDDRNSIKDSCEYVDLYSSSLVTLFLLQLSQC